jgi:lipid II:glycine glycyltransferase (peptidoglycan interpeptide bridge formation enzyme)
VTVTSQNNTTQTDDWNAFVAASPFGDVLQCLEWGELKKPLWQPLPVALDIEGRRKAAALVLKRKIPRTNRAIFYIPRGPILDWSDADAARQLLTKLRALAKRHRAILIKIDPAVPASTPGVENLLRELGFRPSPDADNSFGGTQPRYVMKLDICPPLDEVMKGFHTKWRYNIRLAERKGVSVKSDCTRDDVKVFHDIYRATAERDEFTGRPLSYFEKMWDTLVESGLGRLFITEYEGKPLSAAICFILGRQCWYVYGASSNEHRNVMPNHAMQWAMMNWAKERGCEVYDFRGVHDVKPEDSGQSLLESPDGLVRFKAGFNAELVRYIGEWDLPLSKTWYWLWGKLKKR